MNETVSEQKDFSVQMGGKVIRGEVINVSCDVCLASHISTRFAYFHKNFVIKSSIYNSISIILTLGGRCMGEVIREKRVYTSYKLTWFGLPNDW